MIPLSGAVMMTEKQIVELLEIARADPVIWEALKARELETEKALAEAARQGRDIDDRDVILDPWLRPSRDEIVSSLLEKRYGKGHNFFRGTFTIAIRRVLREELGLPT